MSRAASIDRMKGHIVHALREKDWSTVERAAEQLKSLLIEAVIEDSPDHITTIRSIFADLRAEVNIRHRVQTKAGPEWMSAMLMADQSTAALAARARPRPIPATYKAPVRTARHRILLALAKGPAARLSGAEIAARAGLAPRTVSILLTNLADTALVSRERVGKEVLNRITADGRKALDRERERVVRRAPKNRDLEPLLTNSIVFVVTEAPQAVPLPVERQPLPREMAKGPILVSDLNGIFLAGRPEDKNDSLAGQAGGGHFGRAGADGAVEGLRRLRFGPDHDGDFETNRCAGAHFRCLDRVGSDKNDVLIVEELQNPAAALAPPKADLPPQAADMPWHMAA